MKTQRVPVGLEAVRGELAGWRERRRKGDRIPEGVWRDATRAVREYGLNAVSRVLGLDYYQLKRRAEGSTAAGAGQPMFVDLSELCGGAEQRATGGLACVVELEKGNGVRMRICVREAVAVDWGKLKEAFLGA